MNLDIESPTTSSLGSNTDIILSPSDSDISITSLDSYVNQQTPNSSNSNQVYVQDSNVNVPCLSSKLPVSIIILLKYLYYLNITILYFRVKMYSIT